MVCKKCNSTNVNVQLLSETRKKKKGALYWILIGWWFELFMWLFLTLPWLIIKIFKPDKYKNKVTKRAVCQDCGFSWEL